MTDTEPRLAALRQAWAGQESFTLLSSRFGDAREFEAVRALWRSDPSRPLRLTVFSVASQTLAAPWPPPTRNFHLLDFEQGRLRLLLAQGDASPWRQARQLWADMLWVDGRDMPYLQACARLAANGARLLLRHATAPQEEDLRKAGFQAEAPGGWWRFKPHPRQRLAEPAVCSPDQPRTAIVIGAGIGGACAAAALARRGWQCTVLDARAQPAGGASGNAAALFHGTVHGADGTHARFTRAAALHAQRVFAELLARGVVGAASGLVRAGTNSSQDQDSGGQADASAWVQRWDAKELARRRSGLLPGFADSAWFFPGGGWIDAGAAVRALLDAPGIEFRGGAAAAHLQRQGTQWQVLNEGGTGLGKASLVVLATAGAGDQAPAPMAALLASAAAQHWPYSRSRGQVTALRHDGGPLPWPVAGGGYALSLGPGELLCGATNAAQDDAAGLRDSDHHFNLNRLQAQTGLAPRPGSAVSGRVGWRERTPDGLPVVGAALAMAQATKGPRAARPARVPGLLVLGALAGRGFTWGPLAGEVLASLADGSAVPLEADLLDALDPARFWLRQSRLQYAVSDSSPGREP